MTHHATHMQQIQDKLGFVPMFAQTMESLTDSVGPCVDVITRFNLSATSIEPKTRALIGIGAATASGYQEMVAFQTGFHPEITESALNEAQFIASHVLGFSTFLAGRVPSFETFKEDVDKIAAALKRLGQQKPAIPPEGNAQDQIRAVYGFVPHFLSEMARLPGALDVVWRLMRAYHFEKTHLDPHTRAMVNLAAATAIRCPHSVYLYTNLARIVGVSEVQMQEVAFLASGTAQWGSYLRSRGIGRVLLHADAKLLRERVGALRA